MSTSRRKRPPNCNSTCKCDLHQFVLDKYDTSPNRTFNTLTSHDFSKKSLNHLISLGVMSNRARYICNLCVDHGKFLLSGSSASEDLPSNSSPVRDPENETDIDEMIDSEEEEILVLIDNLIGKLRERKNISTKLVEKTCVLASVVGKMFVGDQMSEEYGVLQGLYKDAVSYQRVP